MGESRGVRILIATCGEAAARHLAGVLRDLGGPVWLGRREIPPDERPDVIVVDSDALAATGQESDEVGVIRIGSGQDNSSAPADVCLPHDASARELQLACRLLGEIVRLRRQQRDGAELHRRLTEEALTDPLTGLPNRRAWDRALAERFAAAGPRRLCLAILDLDHFKGVNDAHGHAVGDAVLRAAGQAICTGLREEDFVARLGGDEFGLLLWMPDEATAAAAIDRVRAALPSRLTEKPTCLPVSPALADEQPVAPNPTSWAASLVVTASAGYQLVPAGVSLSPDALYFAADAALHTAKEQGRSRTVGASVILNNQCHPERSEGSAT